MKMDDIDIKMGLHKTSWFWNEKPIKLEVNSLYLMDIAREVKQIFGCDISILWEFLAQDKERSRIMIWVSDRREHYSFRNLTEVREWMKYQKDLRNKEVV